MFATQELHCDIVRSFVLFAVRSTRDVCDSAPRCALRRGVSPSSGSRFNRSRTRVTEREPRHHHLTRQQVPGEDANAPAGTRRSRCRIALLDSFVLGSYFGRCWMWARKGIDALFFVGAVVGDVRRDDRLLFGWMQWSSAISRRRHFECFYRTAIGGIGECEHLLATQISNSARFVVAYRDSNFFHSRRTIAFSP